MAQEDFHTLKGYALMEQTEVTSSMEDYLEMIYRLSMDGRTIRIKDLSGRLHVKPSSASKMAGNLKTCGLIRFERYGTIFLTDEGVELGKYLLFRHEVLHRFFCLINDSDNELEEVEKVEHFLSPRTICNIRKWLDRYETSPVKPDETAPKEIKSLV